jgi:adenosyl cobinamide kinase/adenosyl cobinamide phosphate guanylyltransferase
LPVFDSDTQHRIATKFQAKLLSFRRANLGAACKFQFDVSKFTFALRDLARSIATATPDDAELQAEVWELLREHDAEIRSERWTELSSVAIEAVLIAGHESPGGVIYVADLAEIAQEILRRRGEAKAEITAGVLGKTLKLLGFTTEPRDARGKKLLLTEAVLSYARQLARDFGGPEVEGDESAGSSQQA